MHADNGFCITFVSVQTTTTKTTTDMGTDIFRQQNESNWESRVMRAEKEMKSFLTKKNFDYDKKSDVYARGPFSVTWDGAKFYYTYSSGFITAECWFNCDEELFSEIFERSDEKIAELFAELYQEAANDWALKFFKK